MPVVEEYASFCYPKVGQPLQVVAVQNEVIAFRWQQPALRRQAAPTGTLDSMNSIIHCRTASAVCCSGGKSW